MLRALISFLLGEDRFVTIEQLYEAVCSARLQVTGTGQERWSGREGYIRLMNDQVSLFYRETSWSDGKHVETIDMHAFAHRGGVWVTFVNDDVQVLTQNAIKKNPELIDADDKLHLWQILLTIRHCVHA